MFVGLAILSLVMPPQSALGQVQGDQETDMPGVTARLLFVRHDGTTTTIAIMLRNSGSSEATSSTALDFSKFVLVDVRGGRKYFPMKDQNGHYLGGPISDWNGGGRWFPSVPAKGPRTVFAIFERLAAGTKVSIQAPLLPPFDDVDLDAVASHPPSVEDIPQRALSGQVVSVVRGNGQLRVRVKIVRAPTGEVDSEALKYSDASVLDPGSRKQYWLLKDADGNWLAQPRSDGNDGGRFFVSTIPPKGQTFLNLSFTPPPDSVKSVVLLLPGFAPTPIDIEGTAGAGESGTTAAGRAIGLEKALNDLKAEVTPERIKINLAADVLFDFDKADIKTEAEASLAQVVTVVKAYPDATIDIAGHTDGKGADAYNQALSEKRAAAVAQWVAAHAGVEPPRFHTGGFGKTKPLAPNTKPDGSDDPEGRAKNRRVEIVVNRKG
jgi:photosystem I P700 chlorophyll a apoprotein A2